MFVFLVLFLSITINTQILIDYGKGNLGNGPDNHVDGANNTWIGKQNTIKGQQNTVIGNQNKIKGQNNIVQGNNNIVGDLSPEEMAKLQNQMMDHMESRFANMFKIFATKIQTQNKPSIEHSQSYKQSVIKNNQTLSTQKLTQKTLKNDQPLKENRPSISKLQAIINTTQNKAPLIVQKQSNLQPKQAYLNLQFSKSRNRLIFRTYGNYGQETIVSDWINRVNRYSTFICQRFNKCFQKQQKMFFSTIYPISFFNHHQ